MGSVSVGMDMVDVREVAEAIARFGSAYCDRIYTPGELAYAFQSPSEAPRRLGARFAAKEATLKALRAGDVGVDPRSIEVVRAADGACEIVLTGAALEAARQAGVTALAVSLTHQGHMAAAVVVAERGAHGVAGGPSEQQGNVTREHGS